MTIIIPYLNNPIDLAVLLVQLQSQTVNPRAIFIADNSGTDEAKRIAERYYFNKDIEIAIQPNVGKIHESWNAGIDWAGDDDVAILNDDIMVSEDFIEVYETEVQLGDSMLYCPENDGFPPIKHVREGYRWKHFWGQGLADKRLLTEKELTLLPDLKGWCMILPRSTIQKIGKFDEEFNLYFGDTDYEARILKSGGSIAFINHNVNHFGSTSTLRVKEKQKINNWYAEDEKQYKEKWNI